MGCAASWAAVAFESARVTSSSASSRPMLLPPSLLAAGLACTQAMRVSTQGGVKQPATMAAAACLSPRTPVRNIGEHDCGNVLCCERRLLAAQLAEHGRARLVRVQAHRAADVRQQRHPGVAADPGVEQQLRHGRQGECQLS